MANLQDYDTQVECQSRGGVWAVEPAPLCYLPVNNLPPDTIEIVQPPQPSNDVYYLAIQNICMASISTGAWLYPLIWGLGVFRRLIKARI